MSEPNFDIPTVLVSLSQIPPFFETWMSSLSSRFNLVILGLAVTEILQGFRGVYLLSEHAFKFTGR